jgi:hypothetical protein
MSAMLSAPAAIPATRLITFAPGPARVRRIRDLQPVADQPRKTHGLGQRDHLDQPRVRHQVRVVELDIDHADSMRRFHLADAPRT